MSKSKIMNPNLLRLLACVILSCLMNSCTNVRTSNEIGKNDEVIQSDIVSHEFIYKKLSESTEQVEYLIQESNNAGFILNLNLRDEKAFIQINDKKIPCSFNFYYNASLDYSLELIKLLKKKSDKLYYFILPTISEEYLTFEIVEVNLKNNSFSSGVFEIDQHIDGGTNIFYSKADTELNKKGDEFIIYFDTLSYSGSFSEIEL